MVELAHGVRRGITRGGALCSVVGGVWCYGIALPERAGLGSFEPGLFVISCWTSGPAHNTMTGESCVDT